MSEKIASLHRSRLARETGTIKKDWGGKLSVALVYPNSYRMGMSNLGYQTVYHLLNKRPDVVAERVFLPEEPEMSLLLQTGKPLLSMESGSALSKFQLIAFSLSFENDYPNVLKILELGKVPLFAEQRDSRDSLVMAGGITTFLNPEPLAPFVDIFLLGEAEGILDAFLDCLLDLRFHHDDRDDFKGRLARNLRSLYVPSLYRPEYKEDGTLKGLKPRSRRLPDKIEVARADLTKAPPTVSVVRTPDTEFSDMTLLELSRGCGRSCRFCAAGYVYRPPRRIDPLKAAAALEKVGGEGHRVGLISAAVSDLPGIERFTEMLLKKGRRFSVSSLRADTITRSLLDHLKRTGQKTLAIAPEAGTERMRKVINKHLNRTQILKAVRMISRSGHFDLRLYFLIGLPTETWKDVKGILHLVKGIKEEILKESRPRGRVGRLRLSINCFVPKPFTPFQWCALEHVSSLREKQTWLKRELSKEGGIKVGFDLPRWAYIQSLWSLGDRRVASILHGFHRARGNWKKFLQSSKAASDFFVYRPKGPEEALPWDFIDHGIKKEHLLHEYDLAQKGLESDPCRVGTCRRCGVC